MARLPLSEGLTVTHRCDPECSALADKHYSRQTVGAREFIGNGKTLVLRDDAGDVVFAWLFCKPGMRRDHEDGYNCTIFRNESDARASDFILQAERAAVKKWGAGRAFTYIDPRKVPAMKSRHYPVWGYCFYRAGWRFKRLSKDGKHLLEKDLS